MQFERDDSVSQRLESKRDALTLQRSDQSFCRLDDEDAVSSGRLKKAKFREVRIASPADAVQNPTSYFWPGVNAAAGMERLDRLFGRRICYVG